IDLDPTMTVTELLEHLRAVMRDVEEHRIPFGKLVESVTGSRQPGHSPLFDIVFVFQGVRRTVGRPAGEPQVQSAPAALDSGAFELLDADIERGVAMFDLLLVLEESREEITGWFEFRSEIFDRSRIERMAADYV